MPWEIERAADTLRVRLTSPIDWDGLREGLLAEFSPRPMTVFLPTTLPFGTPEDKMELAALWESLMDLGVPIQRE